MRIRVAKKGKSALSNNPNDLIFDSNYNTFKIIKSGIKTALIPGNSINYEVVQAHGLLYTPLVTAFVNEDGQTVVYPEGGGNIALSGAKVETVYSTKLVKVLTDPTNIKFYFDSNAGDKSVHIKYYCLDTIF